MTGAYAPRVTGAAAPPEDLDDAFYAVADSMSLAEAERFARAVSSWRPVGSASTVSTDGPARDLLEVLGIRDARVLDVDRLWSARRTQGRQWMRFPIGLDPSGEVVELDLKETSQYGMGMHSVLIGFSGSGKSETIITEVMSLALTHSPETVNVAFLDWKMKSAGIVLEEFPHVVASVSNLGDEIHLVERMLEALEGELDRRGALCAATNCKDLNVYNEKRMIDPSLEPVPGLVVIIDEYQELFGSELGPKFIDLCWRIVRQGRSLHVFLQLAGQTVDVHRLQKIRSLIGFFMALRTGTEEDSREAIGSTIAAHLPEKGKEGTGYLREGQRPPREFRAFYSSAPFIPPSESGPAPVAAAGTWFTPRPFTATAADDEDGLLAHPEPGGQNANGHAGNGQRGNGHVEPPAAAAAPGELPPTVVDTVVKALKATGARPPRQLWLPPLVSPAPADELVRLSRGKPWDVDYGDNPGLAFPVGIEDRPRQHRQDVHHIDLLTSNALVIGAPQSGVTTTLVTMMTTAALTYRPERVQFYCIAAGGPSLAAAASLPHVAGLAPALDREGVGRIIASVQGIVAEREATFARTGLDMDEVRRIKFGRDHQTGAGPQPNAVPIAGGDVVLVIDGWATFAAEYPQYVDQIVALSRQLSYGVHVVVSHTSYLQGFKQALKPLATSRIELRLTDPSDSEMDRQLAKKVPKNIPGRGITKAGMHLLIGVPELGERPGGRVGAREVGAVVAAVSGVQKAATVSRLPESVPFEEVARLADSRKGLLAFGLSEVDLGPAYLDLVDHPHAVAVGAPRSGRSNFLRVMCQAITSTYHPDEARIVVLDPRRTLLGVVQGAHLREYAYTQTAIKEAVRSVVAELDARQPPPGTSQQDMMTKKFWSGPEIFVVVDDAGVWPMMDNPLMALAPHIEQARDTGLHVLAATAVANWNQVAIGNSLLGKLRASLAPTLILDGRRDAGKIVGDIVAEPQRPGKAIFFTRSGTTGALIAWSSPPTFPGSPTPQTSPAAV
ncbi:type VII secretion protein EccCb [Mycobacterium sp. MYCO198283]|uniref:type VII secretion protein EccCb n=1 Tax=Mycobacterium sp. MYCO198283 TaxID=2883505 RepID=UPI001E4B4227|nr:type VII secretion protein EccCb [Mycobacterium sp. MYCO198283]MCG5433043.1 type VII secretion protein EccCb [Mycobacterium sp. MYCO198283]